MTIKFIVNLIIALTFCSSAFLAVSYASPLNPLDIKVGDASTYQGTDQGVNYTIDSEVTSIDQTTFPTATYVYEENRSNGETTREWIEKAQETVKLWGTQEIATGEFIKFSAGLIWAWYPMQVGDQRYSSATVKDNLYPGIILNASLTVDVLSKESVILDFDTLEAFKMRYKLRLWITGYDETTIFYSWVVPYLGEVKYQDDTSQEVLTNFAIAGGSITETTDFDGDGLKDYQELIKYDTNWEDADTDDDGFSDGVEVKLGTDPNDPNSHPSRAMPWIPLLLLYD